MSSRFSFKMRQKGEKHAPKINLTHAFLSSTLDDSSNYK